MPGWNFADLWEVVAAARGDAPALVHAGTTTSWAAMDRRADALAAAVLDAGVGRDGKVAQYLYNGPPYLESVFAACKAGLAPVNTNYRYTAHELVYLWDNADVEAVVFDVEFAPRIDALRPQVPRVRLWLAVGPAAACPGWAVPYETAASAEVDGPVRAPWGRSADDLVLIYTGGTTGMPKGVMWRHDDLFALLNRAARLRYDPAAGLDGAAAALRAPARHPSPRLLPGPPLMHGTGLLTAMSVLDSGGTIVMPDGHHFDAERLLDTVADGAVTELSIVGDAFARPLLAALDAHPGRWDLSRLWLIISSGVIWSAEVKAALTRHLPHVTLVDNLGSSEAISFASSRSTAGATASTAGFVLGPDARVITEAGDDVAAGSGQRGMLAVRGPGPVGYYKDEAKSAATFRVIGGERWTVTGDWAEVAADGAVRLLGRGSMVVNTGGEKVFPEEVEEALKTHPDVADAVIVGLPDERFGEVVVAVVEAAAGAEPDPGVLADWVRDRLAGYKVPRHFVPVGTIGRAPNGKVDYKRLRGVAAAAVGVAL